MEFGQELLICIENGNKILKNRLHKCNFSIWLTVHGYRLINYKKINKHKPSAECDTSQHWR